MIQDRKFDGLTPTAVHRPMGYAHAVRVHRGQPLFLAGQVALDPSGAVVGKGDFRAQAQQVFENLKAVVESAGGRFGDIVKLNDYVVDVSHFEEKRDVRDRYIDPQHPPASTLVQVAALVRPDFLIEVEAIAILD